MSNDGRVRNQVTWPKEQRRHAAEQKVGLFAVAVETVEGSRIELAGPSNPELDAVMAEAIAKVIFIFAELAKAEKAAGQNKK